MINETEKNNNTNNLPKTNNNKAVSSLNKSINSNGGGNGSSLKPHDKNFAANKKRTLPNRNMNKKPQTAPKNNQVKSVQDSKKPKETGAKRPHKNKLFTTDVSSPSIRIMFLGGLNEIGKNLTLFECGKDMFILDCGLAFPDVEMLGVDLVIPDFSYIEKNIDRIKGLVITHGHEDHIGSIPYLLKNVNVPIYGTGLAIGLVGGKLKEHNLFNKAKLNVVKPGQTINLGCMDVEFIHVNHSIPDAVGVAIYSPAGTIVHTGDFKIDFTPTQGEMIDLGRFAELGNKGVLALLADSTNADRPGYTMTEKKLSASFDTLFRQAENKRIIVASFASNIGRIQQLINCAANVGRKVAFSGRSMINYVAIAGELGYLDVPPGVIIDIDLLNKFPNGEVVLITTGSQGEPMSALSRMATADHRKVEVGPEDFIIISANPIPGNEKMVGSVVNELMKRGCTVVYESMYEVHVSGHACAEELKLMQGIVKPQYFIPVHGEQKHLRRHAEIAKEMGVKASNIFIGEIGSAVELSREQMKPLGKVLSGRVLVDGLGIGDVGSIVLRDRKHLAQDGLIVVVCTMDFTNGCVVSGPDIVSRGFVYVREAEPLMDAARAKVMELLDDCNNKGIHEWGTIKTKMRDILSKFFYEKTKRSPMILPIIMEV